MDPLALFTYETFRDRSGEQFEVGGVPLTLVSATKDPGTSIREGGSFALLFQGPLEPQLEQATHALSHGELGEFALFLVPVGRDAEGLQYQAIFN